MLFMLFYNYIDLLTFFHIVFGSAVIVLRLRRFRLFISDTLTERVLLNIDIVGLLEQKVCEAC